MELVVSQIDLKKTATNWPKDRPFEPALLVRQPTTHPQRWLVSDGPITPGEPPSWSSSLHDQYVRIPVFEYYLRPEADLAFAYVLQLGLSCAGHLPGEIKKFHVVTGSPVDLLYGDDINTSTGLRYWFGFAVVLANT